MNPLLRKSVLALAVVTTVAVPAVPVHAEPAPVVQADFTAAATITRDQVMARSQAWVNERVPYSMTSNHSSGWRKDCSGFVSMAWDLGKPGLSTVTLVNPNVSHPISKDELQPGDILIKGGPGTEGAAGHVRIFGGWLDTAKTRYWVHEQTPPHTMRSEYSWAATAAEYPPYRYNNIAGDIRKARAGINDVNGDGWGDLLTTAPNGEVFYYGNSINAMPTQPYGPRESVGEGFQNYTTVRAADLTGDGYAELIGVRTDGELFYWENNKNSNPDGRPYTFERPTGSGFNRFADITLADVTGDGYADLLGIEADGEVYLYPNNINSNGERKPFVTEGKLVGSGFGIYSKVRAADLTGDGYAELVAMTPSGDLFYYENNINSNGGVPYGGRKPTGGGFNRYSDFTLADVTGDGYADLTGWQPDGEVFYYPNNINTNADRRPFVTGGDPIGQGFHIYNRLI
ncbi:VCBS repeat-containing protein [Lentzea alba]|uniref:C40 family peptidase n=1 Tax=Lentzea alba TaxID=2714351 RepID=UPI0039BFA887